MAEKQVHPVVDAYAFAFLIIGGLIITLTLTFDLILSIMAESHVTHLI